MSKIEIVYLIHHSHTDIGYTHDQPIVWDLHGRFIDEGLRLAEESAGSDSDGAFRWTVENTGVLYEWLRHAPADKVERFIALERAGRIEVTGMFANLTPLLDLDQLVESLQLVGRLRKEYGFTIRNAMNCDVNGENWPLVDLLLDAGIEAFSMAINTHFGGAPLRRPAVFHWEGPSGRTVLAYNGWPYDTGWRFGIGKDSDRLFREWWPRVQQHLDEVEYPLPALMVQSYHPFGDNGPAYSGFTTFIDQWNAAGNSPRLVFATPQMWWDEVRRHADALPTYRGDWTDFWNFGSVSSAREQAINRRSRDRLRAADAAAAATLGLDPPLDTAHAARVFNRYRDAAWQALNLWDEHTWGADLSLRAPESEDTLTQWYHKAHYAYLARSLSLMLQRDALADFARHVERRSPSDLLVFNPLPWTRTIYGEVAHHVASPRGLPDDATSGRHSQDRVWSTDMWVEAAQTPSGEAQQGRLGLPPVEVPGFGYALVRRADLIEMTPGGFSETAVVENRRFRLTFDTHRGGVASFYDKALDREWVDAAAGCPLNGFVHEEVADKAHPWPRWLLFRMAWQSAQVERDRGWKPGWRANREQPRKVLVHRVYPTPYGLRVIQVLEAPGIYGPLVQSAFLPAGEDFVEFESWFTMTQTTHPESTYLVFPFDLPGARAYIDLGGEVMETGRDQIPGVCFDYYTAQHWVDLSNDTAGVTVALPDNPMVQFGGFHFGDNQQAFHLERAMLLGWVTNTYWETNFRTHQPGEVHALYRVYPHEGGFDPAAAHRRGLETAMRAPLMQHMGEPAASATFPAAGALLHLPEQENPGGGIFTLHIKPTTGRLDGQWNMGGLVTLRLYNSAGESREACVRSGLLRIESAQGCDLMENPQEDLPVEDGVLRVAIEPHRLRCVSLRVRPAAGAVPAAGNA